MRKNKYSNLEYDEHIIDALLKLKTPIIGKNKKSFFFKKESNGNTSYEHIALKRHRLKVRDIESIPEILRHPKIEMTDPNNKNYRNYYGIRKGKENGIFIKIITWPDKKDTFKEYIVTIYPTNIVKIE